MIFNNTQVSNFQGAFRGLRNPMNSWDKSDSAFGITDVNYCHEDFYVADTYCDRDKVDIFSDHYDEKQDEYAAWLREQGILRYCGEYIEYAFIGATDLNLAQRMIKAGTSDRKFLRQIFVSVDITAPLYWFKEFDTYKVGTTANSTSTMHKLASTPITLECFETDDYTPDTILYNRNDLEEEFTVEKMANDIITYCETLRQKYNETKEKKYWKELVRWLPNGWLQTRTITLNYENLRNIYFQRKSHKLTEWHQFCDWVKTLPYANELILLT